MTPRTTWKSAVRTVEKIETHPFVQPKKYDVFECNNEGHTKRSVLPFAFVALPVHAWKTCSWPLPTEIKAAIIRCPYFTEELDFDFVQAGYHFGPKEVKVFMEEYDETPKYIVREARS
jgi:hypothetical protein